MPIEYIRNRTYELANHVNRPGVKPHEGAYVAWTTQGIWRLVNEYALTKPEAMRLGRVLQVVEYMGHYYHENRVANEIEPHELRDIVLNPTPKLLAGSSKGKLGVLGRQIGWGLDKGHLQPKEVDLFLHKLESLRNPQRKHGRQ